MTVRIFLVLLFALFCSVQVLASQADPLPESPSSQSEIDPVQDEISPLPEEETTDEPAAGPRVLPLATIPLQVNLRFTVRPTILSLIPPESVDDFGEGLIRISGLDGQQVQLHYEIKEEIEKERNGEQLFELQEAPLEMRTEYLTRIRRGDVIVRDILGGGRIANPLFWGTGDFHADEYGLLWVDPQLLAELKSSGSSDWELQCAADPASAMGLELSTLIEARRRASGLPDDSSARLELIEAHARYLVPVNGAMSQLEAIHARDSFGLAEYWFLDDPDNPLLLKMSFIASPDAAPTQGGITRQVQAGIGFAMTSINY